MDKPLITERDARINRANAACQEFSDPFESWSIFYAICMELPYRVINGKVERSFTPTTDEGHRD